MGGPPDEAQVPVGTQIAHALAVPTRAQLLELLCTAEEPRSASDLAASVGLHVNTVRSHLELLVKARLATRRADAPRGPGRPHIVYAAIPHALTCVGSFAPDRSGDGYRDLATVLVDELGSMPDADQLALDAGRRWSSVIDGLGWPDLPRSADDACACLVDLLDRLGFVPTTEPMGDRIYLHACPFSDLARRSTTVVCGIHLGLMRAAADRLHSPLAVATIDPFVRADLCVVQLTTT
jgi:predicted ArsR family transcriptional regulator